MLGVGQKLPEFKITGVKPGFNSHEENGVSAFEAIDQNSFEGKWKVSQNRPEGDRKGVAAGLAEAHPEMAALVRRYGRIGEGA